LVAVTTGTSGAGAGSGTGAFKLTVFVVNFGDLGSPGLCRSERLIAAAIGTNGMVKSENDSRQAINTLRLRLEGDNEIRVFIDFSWVRAKLAEQAWSTSCFWAGVSG
jgi:hypothetical protein